MLFDKIVAYLVLFEIFMADLAVFSYRIGLKGTLILADHKNNAVPFLKTL
jgi:hypothetical protein